MSEQKHFHLSLTGLKENNLKDLSITLPHDQLIAVTGLSGSGKSTLAFDTIYAEGQRRYLETFSSYVRQFLDKVKKPDLESSENVRPAIAIEQKNKIHSSRSSVGTLTDLNDYLGILFANFALPYSPINQQLLQKHSPNEVAELISGLNLATDYLYICAPCQLTTKKKSSAKKVSKKDLAEQVNNLQLMGYNRFLIPNSANVYKLAEDLNQLANQDLIYILIDRLKPNQSKTHRLIEAVEQAYQLGKGIAYLAIPENEQINFKRFTSFYSDPAQDNLEIKIPIPKPGLFSPNNPLGACPHCKGFGANLIPDSKKIIIDPELSLIENAVDCWKGPAVQNLKEKLIKFASDHKIKINLPWSKLSTEEKDLIFNYEGKGYLGLNPWFKKIERKSYKAYVRIYLTKYRSPVICDDCQGSGNKSEALLFRLNNQNVSEVRELPINELGDWIAGLKPLVNKSKSLELETVFQQSTARIKQMINLGLDYLSLSRPAKTLSGGETQRVNLVSAIGSELVSTQFVLDEPSVGLHPRDSERLMQAIKELKNRGNSILMVEHDPDCILAADQILHLGPKAGKLGGEVVYYGPPSNWKHKFIPVTPKKNSKSSPSQLIVKVEGVRNLKKIDLRIPLSCLVVLSGVSGSGKSSLAIEVILKAYQENQRQDPSSKFSVLGLEQFQQVLAVDQSSLVKSPRSNIATYSKLWEMIREELADSPLAKQKLFSKSTFSFNVEGGRCPHCKGAGYLKEEMQFLSDVYVTCDLCLGQRFQDSVLDVTYQDRNVAEWLKTTVSECQDLLINHLDAFAICQSLNKLGLGHLTLGHPLSQLSGGEAQRLKLVPFIQKATRGDSLLIFDEPSTGLSQEDVKNLLLVFNELIDAGHSIICIEHNQDIILAADQIIDLGPEGGKHGGQVVLEGTPTDFLKKINQTKSLTAKYLQSYVTRYQASKLKFDKEKPSKHDSSKLKIFAAKEHNLKNIDLEIPHNEIVVFTGVSGSGKSTIAKDIVYAEGQRKYLDCLSPYARQFIKELAKPQIASIENLRPTICVYQHTFQPGKLSTLGTVSEIYNFLRLLFAKVGTPYCPDHPEYELSSSSLEQILNKILQFGEQTVKLLVPVIKSKKGHHRPVFIQARKSEIEEVRVDGIFGPVSRFEEGLSRNQVHNIEFVYAKVVPNRIPADLILEAIRDIISLSGGNIIANVAGQDQILSTRRGCPQCNRGYLKPDPEDFSFNSRRGRCVKCSGSGKTATDKICPSCQGTRINQTSLNIKINKKNIFELAKLNSLELANFLEQIKFPEQQLEIADTIISEIKIRTNRLTRLGLEYLPLSRSCQDLSKGELQRLKLANSMGSPLNGVLYIFDEPSAGLHPNDNRKILKEFTTLKDQGNSVYIIEHDQDTINYADHLIELGPGGGRDGGQIIYNGSVKKYPTHKIPQIDWSPNPIENKPLVKISSKAINNIKSLEASFPLQSLVTICGVSGSGKSTFLNNIFLNSIDNLKNLHWKNSLASVTTELAIDRLLVVDQSPIGKNSRSTPASYLKIWDEIRKLLAQMPLAKTRGWGPSYFSYNSATGGRCPECNGTGTQKLEMSFLAEAKIECPLCQGKRYTDETLSIKYLDKNASEIFNLTFEEAKNLFTNYPKIYRLLKSACDLGLGYLTLGQTSTTLSGGEAQRLKLTEELAVTPRGHTLYVFDEPSVGLHQQDVLKLLKVLKDITNRGDSVVLIEHDPLIIKYSDYLIEMGPGAGDLGGEIIFSGPITNIQKSKSLWKKLL